MLDFPKSRRPILLKRLARQLCKYACGALEQTQDVCRRAFYVGTLPETEITAPRADLTDPGAQGGRRRRPRKGAAFYPPGLVHVALNRIETPPAKP